MNNRDDFSAKTKSLLANRAGVKCSNPDCRKPTSGANTNPDKITNIGVAAHICAAAEGGPRYDATMTPAQRKSSRNGIWLCQSCAKLIDSDPVRYSKEKLHGWKRLAEALSTIELEKNIMHNSISGMHDTTPVNQGYPHWFSKREHTLSVKWGYSEIDKLLTLSPGSVVLLAGYSDVEISSLAQNITRHNIKAQGNVIYFNLKQSSNTVLSNILAAESFVGIESIRVGQLREDEWKRFVQATAILKDSNLIFEPYNTGRSASEYLISAIKYGSADFIVLDDLDGLGLDSREQSQFMYQLRSAAAESNTTVLILFEIPNKPTRVDKRPTISDPQISELRKFCDVIQFIYQNEYTRLLDDSDSIELELINAKYYSMSSSLTFHLKGLIRYAAIVEYEKAEFSTRDLAKKYPGLIAGATLISEHLSNI